MQLSELNWTRIFPNSTLQRPHVETNYNADALGKSAGSSQKHIAIIGSANDGEPNKVYELGSLLEARSIFGSGDIVDACEVIWGPNKKYSNGGGKVFAMRVENATQAILNAPALRFVSKIWGQQANKTQIALEKSDLTNSYKITIDYSPENYHKVYDNLGQVFKLQYKGNSPKATAKYSVTKDKDGYADKFILDIQDTASAGSGETVLNPTTTTTTMKLNGTTTTVKPTTSDVASANKVSAPQNVILDTVSNKGAEINADSGTTTVKPDGDTEMHTIHQVFDLNSTENARLYDLMHSLSLIPNLEVQMLADGDNTRMQANTLDEATDVDITGDINSIDKAGYVWALRADIVDKLLFDSYVSVSAVYSEEMSKPFGLTNMINGTTGEVPLSWSDSIQMLAQTDAYYIVPLTSSSAIHQEAKKFVIDQSSAGHPMFAVVGAGTNEGIGQLISRQLDLKSERVALVGTSGYFETYDEVKLHLPAYMVGALAVGVASGLPIGGDITNKYVNMLSIDQDFTSQQIDQLYQNGIITVEAVYNRGTESGFRFVAGITTYNSTNEPVKSKIGLREITDFLFGDLRIALEKDFIGKRVSVGSADVIKTYVGSFLLKEKNSENGLIVDYDENDIEIQIDGSTVWIRFTVKPSQTIDKIFVYGAYENYTESAGGSGTSSHNILYGGNSDIPTTNSTNTDITKSQNQDINAGYGFN